MRLISICGATQTASKGRHNERSRWRCLACGRSFGETLGTPLYRLKTALPEIIRAIQVVLHRGSLRAAEELTGHDDETIAVWLQRLGEHAEAITERLVHDLPLSEVEVDELWSFVSKKGVVTRRRGPGDPPATGGEGERWGAVSVERASRFVVAWASGPRDEALAEKVVRVTRDRTGASEAIAYVTDGWEAYETAVKRAYWEREVWEGNPNRAILKPTDKVYLTQAVKHRKDRRLARVEVRATTGPPAALPYAVCLERLNGTLRDRLGCLTRKTHAFAKLAALWDALFGLTLFEQNWLRPYIALRVRLAERAVGRRHDQRTPAMAIGLTDHVWTWTEFLTMRGKAH